MNYYYTFLKMYFGWLNTPINVFGNSSNNSEIKNDTSLFAEKSYLRTNHSESIIEEDIDVKSQFRKKN